MTKLLVNLYKKINEIISEEVYVQKNGYNTNQKYAFVKESDVLEAVRVKLLSKNLLLRTTTLHCSKEEKLTTVEVQFTLIDLDSGEAEISVFQGQGMDGGDKGVYKAYTGAKKYFLLNTFMIATGDDPENSSEADKESSTSSRFSKTETKEEPVAAASSNGSGEDLKLKTNRNFKPSSRFRS